MANENCDRATALVRALSAELRDAQQRIRDLEREAMGRLKTEVTFAQLQAEFDAEAENHLTRLQTELAQARQRAAEASGRVAQIEKEADELASNAKRRRRSNGQSGPKLDAEKSLEQLRAGARDEVSRLQFELAEAEDRAKRAEQWVARIRQEVESGLMRSSAAGRRSSDSI